MPRFHMIDGAKVQFSDQEEVARDAEEKDWADGAATRAALGAIQRLEASETPRRMAEATLTDEGKAWLQANRDLIATERAKL